eukprot:11244074-Ditylum_brightwellii.AAC.1
MAIANIDYDTASKEEKKALAKQKRKAKKKAKNKNKDEDTQEKEEKEVLDAAKLLAEAKMAMENHADLSTSNPLVEKLAEQGTICTFATFKKA